MRCPAGVRVGAVVLLVLSLGMVGRAAGASVDPQVVGVWSLGGSFALLWRIGADGASELVHVLGQSNKIERGRFEASGGRWTWTPTRGVPASGTYRVLDANSFEAVGPLGPAVWRRVTLAGLSGADSAAAAYEKARRGNAQAFSILAQRALLGDTVAERAMGELFLAGESVARDDVEAARWIRAAALARDPMAQSNLGMLYSMGRGVEKNLTEAVRWYDAAASQGDLLGLYNLANCYADGRGVARDPVKAFPLYRRSADGGYAAAQHSVGLAYAQGEGVAQDWKQAAAWYAKAAAQGLSASQNNLGTLYRDGHGVEKNLETAAAWYAKAAAQGLPQAETNLAILYYYGRGVLQNRAKAVDLLQSATRRGYAPASHALAAIAPPAGAGAPAPANSAACGALPTLGCMLGVDPGPGAQKRDLGFVQDRQSCAAVGGNWDLGRCK